MEKQISQFLHSLVVFREQLFRNPEPGWEEVTTTSAIERYLRSLSPELHITRPLKTGLVADAVFHQDAPFLALRADIDALEINNTVRHACGHDVHTAIVAGVAILLYRMKIVPNFNLRFIFQPAEEPIPSGAPQMIKAGVLNNVAAILGMHVDPNLPMRTLGLVDGWVNAQSIRFDWTFIGPGGHSARPHQVADPLRAATEMACRANRAARKWETAEHPSVFTVTRLHAGDAYNAIPERAKLTATLRVTDQQVRNEIIAELDRIYTDVSEETGSFARWDVQMGSPPVYNDTRLTRQLHRIAHQHGWKVTEPKRSMGGDDFGWYVQQVPGVMVRLGIRKKKKMPALHSPEFRAPMEAVEMGLRFFLQTIQHLTL